MTWQLRGEYLENRNCDILCPCITSSLQGPADNERCYVPLAMHFSEGHRDGVRLDGLNAVLVIARLSTVQSIGRTADGVVSVTSRRAGRTSRSAPRRPSCGTGNW